MEIEQISPKKPNFGLVVALSAAAMVCAFAFVLLLMHISGHDLIKHRVDTPAKATTGALRTQCLAEAA